MVKYDFLNSNPYKNYMKIIQFTGKNKKVLDVGCSTGKLSKKLMKNGCEIFGIEIDEESAKIAKNHCKEVIIADVDLIESLPYPNEYFDVIIFSDILEHLKSPSDALKKFREYLKNDGYIIVSIPNIANWKIRLELLFGNFRYRSYGILDETHLKFFTKKSVKKLFLDGGFKIVKLEPALGPSLPYIL